MNDEWPEPSPAERWYRLAQEDLAAAEVLLADSSTALRIVGFLFLKAAKRIYHAAGPTIQM